MFGINAELLIDHAWGTETCTMADIKAYRPEASSACSGQVLHCPYTAKKARLVVREMTEQMALDLVEKRSVTDQVVLTVGYDRENLTDGKAGGRPAGEITTDRYGRSVPKHAHGTVNLKTQTSSAKILVEAVLDLYDKIVRKDFLIRRITVGVNHVEDETAARGGQIYEQMDLFTDYAALQKEQEEKEACLNRERRLQEAMLDIRKKYGKNAILKGANLMEGSTAMDRNKQIGGHRA